MTNQSSRSKFKSHPLWVTLYMTVAEGTTDKLFIVKCWIHDALCIYMEPVHFKTACDKNLMFMQTIEGLKK